MIADVQPGLDRRRVVALACSILACSPGSWAESDAKTTPGVPVTAAIVERKNRPIEIRTIGAVQPYELVARRSAPTAG